VTPRLGPPAVPSPQLALAVMVAAADPGTALTPAGHRAAGELHRGNDAEGLVHRAGCQPAGTGAAAIGPAVRVPKAWGPAVHYCVAACPASGLNRLDWVMPAHPAGRQPGSRPASSTGGGDHRERWNTTCRACCPAGPGRDHRQAAGFLGPELLLGAGVGPLFVLISLVGMTG